jgi:hypothetical protein
VAKGLIGTKKSTQEIGNADDVFVGDIRHNESLFWTFKV